MSADDVSAIQQLAACYADAMSRGDVLQAVATFTPDGQLETPTGEPAIGHAAIEQMIRDKVATLELIFQTVHLGLVVVEGDVAHARFPITEWERRTDDAQPFLLLGWYEDQAMRLPEGWRFSHRRLVPRTFARPGFMKSPLMPLSGLNAQL